MLKMRVIHHFILQYYMIEDRVLKLQRPCWRLVLKWLLILTSTSLSYNIPKKFAELLIVVTNCEHCPMLNVKKEGDTPFHVALILDGGQSIQVAIN